jgi:hypothetical protein
MYINIPVWFTNCEFPVIQRSLHLSIPVAPTLEHRASVKRFVSLQFFNLRQSVRLLGREINPPQGRYLHRTTHTQNKHKHPCLE